LEINLDITSKIKKFEDNSEVYRNLIAKRKADGIKAGKKPIISIIIPCYNAEKYIDRCMESIVGQTIGIENLQVIIVNDASTDSTFEKMREWEKRFPENVLLITYTENIRQGGARNIGVCYADAEYISFVDADDWIELDTYEVVYANAKEKKWDVISFKFIRTNSDLQEVNLDFKTFHYEFKKKNGFYRSEIGETGKNGCFGYLVGGVYLRKIIIQNNVWFPEMLAYEDLYWSAVLELYVKNNCIIDKILYHYWVSDETSTTRKRNTEHHFDILYVEIMMLEEYKKRGAFDVFYLELEKKFIKEFYLKALNIIFVFFDDMPDVINFMNETVYSYFPDFLSHLDISEYAEVDQKLLKLLLIKGDISLELMNMVKEAYLKVFNKVMSYCTKK